MNPPFDDMSPEAVIRNSGGTTETRKPTPKRGTAYGRLLVLGTNDLDTATARGYLLKGLISPAEISIWVGPPKCGKSFLMLYVAYMLSLGRSVFGRRVKATVVLYVAAEGEGGIANRIKALRIRYGDSPNFHFIAQPADLLHTTGHLKEMKNAVDGVGAQLVVLDTLSRLMAGGDENAPGDMGMFVRNVTELKHDTGAHVAIVHHGTKSSNGSSPRGHGSLTGADDALVEVQKLEDGSRLASVIHAKDDPDGMRWGFNLEPVELGKDEDDDPINTLIVNEKKEAGVNASKPTKLSDNEKIAMRCFVSAMKANQIMATVGDNHTERAVIHEGDWRSTFYREGMPGEEQNTRRMAYKRAVTGLIAKGVVATMDDLVWQMAKG
jgi:AAA domain-containing protein